MKSDKKILIAEDELLIAKVLRMQFEKLGCIVENIACAGEVVAKANHLQPDVIIMDVFLKEKSSGIEAGKALRANGINTPIIFTTGNSYQETQLLIEGISNVHLLSKPIEFEELLRVINL